MRNSFLRVLFFVLIPVLISAQDFGIKFSGFVKTDFMYDTRQNVTSREGDFLLYPSPKVLDNDKVDLNEKSNVNFLSIQSRLSGAITAPDFMGAKTSGVLEADFFGNENGNFVDANGFRLRHAFAKLTWKDTELLMGQFWHPFFNPNCFAEVLSFNTGVPFQPFSRNPQVRLTQKMNELSVMIALATERDFTSAPSSLPLRNSGMPMIDAQVQFNTKDFSFGAGVDYKKLLPVIVTSSNYQNTEGVSALSATGFFKMNAGNIVVKGQATYGANLYDLTMLGGYFVKSYTQDKYAMPQYSTINNLAVWMEFISTLGKNTQVGLFVGYAKNLGSSDTLFSNVSASYSAVRGSDINAVVRLSPRIVYTMDKFSLGFEVEYTTAGYATTTNGKLNRDSKGVITEAEAVANTRALFSAILKF